MQRLKTKIVVLGVLMLMSILAFTGCGEKTSGLDEDYYVEGNQEVLVVIDYESNLLLAKDPMDIYIDNHKFYTVDNGDSNANIYMLTKGTHVLKVASNKYHYDAEEFEVKNTGDYFSFTIKNDASKVTLSITESGNQYTVLGEEIPATVDDSDKSMSKSQIDAAKKNRTIWSFIWMGVKVCLIFVAFCGVLMVCGMMLSGLFRMMHMEKTGLLIELVGICILSVCRGVTLMTVAFPIVFLIMWRVVNVRIRNVPEEYKNFHAVKEEENVAYQILYATIFAVLLATMPEILSILPFEILHVKWYMIAFVAFELFYVISVMETSLEYPEKVKKFVYEKGIVTEEDILEFISNDEEGVLSDEEIETRTNSVLRTLADLAKIDLIEKDADGKCFRRKE